MTLLLACWLLLAGVLIPAGAADAAPDPAPDDLELILLEQDFAVAANGRWHASFRLDGDLDELPLPTTTTTTTTTSSTLAPTSPADQGEVRPLPSGRRAQITQLRVVVYVPITDRAALAEFVDGGDRNDIDALTTPLTSSLTQAAGGPIEVRLDVPTTVEPGVDGALHLRRAGLYPVAVQVLIDEEVAAEHRTFIDRHPLDASAAAPIDIAVLASVAEPSPDANDELTDEQRAELDALTELANQFVGPLTVALPPATMSGVAAEAPGLGATLREALEGDELLSLPSTPLDPSAAVAVDRADTFARRLRDGEDTVAATLRGLAAVRSAWVTPHPMSTEAATMLRDLGFDVMVFDEQTYGQLDGNIGGFFDTTMSMDVDLGPGGTMPAVMISPLSELLDQERAAPAAPAVQILAELVTTRRELGEDQSRGVILAAPDGGMPDGNVLGALADMVADLDDVRLVTVSALARSTDTMLVDGQRSTVRLPDRAGPDLEGRLERIELTGLSAESAASMLVDDSEPAGWRAQLDALVDTSLSDERVDAVLAEIATSAEAIRDSVRLPQPFDFTLTGRSSTLRLNVWNDSQQTLRVVVRARSPKLIFPGGDQLVELAPAGSTEVVIPVEARSNGTSSIEVELLTPAFEQQINGSVVLTANVNALTGLGQVLTVGALLVLVSWWFGHFRRQRRARSVAMASAASAAALDDTSPDAAEAAAGPGDPFDDEVDVGRAADHVPRP